MGQTARVTIEQKGRGAVIARAVVMDRGAETDRDSLIGRAVVTDPTAAIGQDVVEHRIWPMVRAAATLPIVMIGLAVATGRHVAMDRGAVRALRWMPGPDVAETQANRRTVRGRVTVTLDRLSVMLLRDRLTDRASGQSEVRGRTWRQGLCVPREPRVTVHPQPMKGLARQGQGRDREGAQVSDRRFRGPTDCHRFKIAEGSRHCQA